LPVLVCNISRAGFYFNWEHPQCRRFADSTGENIAKTDYFSHSTQTGTSNADKRLSVFATDLGSIGKHFDSLIRSCNPTRDGNAVFKLCVDYSVATKLCGLCF